MAAMNVGTAAGALPTVGRYALAAEVARAPIGQLWVGASGPDEWVLVRRVPVLGVDAAAIDALCEAAWWALEQDHEHVLHAREMLRVDHDLVLVTDYAEGEPLRALLRHATFKQKTLSVRAVCRILRDVATALASFDVDLGAGGVNPDSIIVGSDGHTRLIDVGVSAAVTRLSTFGASPEIASYLGPEQLESGRASAASDVWGLGVIAWEALSGRRLFSAPSRGAVVDRVKGAKIQRLDEAKPLGGGVVPGDLADVVARALERDEAARFSGTRAFAEALDKFEFATHAEVAAEIATFVDTPLAGRRKMLERARARIVAAPPVAPARTSPPPRSVAPPPPRRSPPSAPPPPPKRTAPPPPPKRPGSRTPPPPPSRTPPPPSARPAAPATGTPLPTGALAAPAVPREAHEGAQRTLLGVPAPGYLTPGAPPVAGARAAPPPPKKTLLGIQAPVLAATPVPPLLEPGDDEDLDDALEPEVDGAAFAADEQPTARRDLPSIATDGELPSFSLHDVPVPAVPAASPWTTPDAPPTALNAPLAATEGGALDAAGPGVSASGAASTPVPDAVVAQVEHAPLVVAEDGVPIPPPQLLALADAPVAGGEAFAASIAPPPPAVDLDVAGDRFDREFAAQSAAGPADEPFVDDAPPPSDPLLETRRARNKKLVIGVLASMGALLLVSLVVMAVKGSGKDEGDSARAAVTTAQPSAKPAPPPVAVAEPALVAAPTPAPEPTAAVSAQPPPTASEAVAATAPEPAPSKPAPEPEPVAAAAPAPRASTAPRPATARTSKPPTKPTTSKPSTKKYKPSGI